MISQKQIDELKRLFNVDGIELSDAVALTVGRWLLERLRAVVLPIPEEKKQTLEGMKKESATYPRSSKKQNRKP